MPGVRNEIVALRARLERLEREANRERDIMIGVTLNALRSVLQVQEATGCDAALTYFQKQAGTYGQGTRQDGTYTEMRKEILDILIQLDLIHPDGRFKRHMREV